MRRPGIVINGKFLTAGPTAVHSVAFELSRALISKNDAPAITMAMPKSKDCRTDALELQIRKIGPLNGILWEQGTLPLALKKNFLLNLCNMTPFLARNAMTMVHDAQVFTTPQSYGQRRSAWARLHIRFAGRLQLGLLTVSEFAKSELVALGIAPPERIHVIHNGVDHVLRVPPEDGILVTHNLTPRRFALALANTQPHKNIGVLLRAFARPELAGLTLVLAGKATAADFADRGHPVPPNVVFAGYVSDGEMRSLQTHALAVCTPSLTEGFGMPPVEGMLLGTPAVIAPCGALPEVCGPGALHANAHDPEAWAAALCRLQTEPETWQGLSDAGRTWAARFTWDAAAERLQAVLASVGVVLK